MDVSSPADKEEDPAEDGDIKPLAQALSIIVLRRGEGDNEFAAAAWRAGDWALTADAFDAVPPKEREKAAASRAAASLVAPPRSTLCEMCSQRAP